MGNFEPTLTIEVIKGGFILHYPEKLTNDLGVEYMTQVRELFTSSRKMNQRIKEVLEKVSTTAVDAE